MSCHVPLTDTIGCATACIDANIDTSDHHWHHIGRADLPPPKAFFSPSRLPMDEQEKNGRRILP